MCSTEAVKPGLSCVSISRAVFSMPGEPDAPGAIQLAWEDSSHTVVDVNADWTLAIVDGPWTDPLGDVDRADFGIWTLATVGACDPLAQVAGGTVVSTSMWLNEVGELTGIDITFDKGVLRLLIWDGDLRAEFVA
jgi:hypothetical protein